MTSGFAHARYRELLYQHGHGYPFWIPEPNDALPDELKTEGIRVGDVGILTDDGGFEYLWNAHLPAQHPHNNSRAPPDFVPLPPLNEAADVRKIGDFHHANTVVSSKSITKRNIALEGELEPAIVGGFVGGGAGFEFSAEGNFGAILTLPRGGARVDALKRGLYRKYAVRHAESWYRYINQDLQLDVQSGALYLVTGTDKCSSWGVASFSRPSGSQSSTLKFIVSGAANSDVSVQNSWSVDFGVAHRTKAVDPSEKNQCVFARGFVITVRDNVLARMLGMSVKTTALDGTHSLPSLIGSSRPYTRSMKSDYDLHIHQVPQNSLQKSPAAIIGEELLNKNYAASFVVVHDEDWISPMQHGELLDMSDFEGSLISYAASLSNIRIIDGVCFLIDIQVLSSPDAAVADDRPTPRETEAAPLSRDGVPSNATKTTSLYGTHGYPQFAGSSRPSARCMGSSSMESDPDLQARSFLQHSTAMLRALLRRFHVGNAGVQDDAYSSKDPVDLLVDEHNGSARALLVVPRDPQSGDRWLKRLKSLNKSGPGRQSLLDYEREIWLTLAHTARRDPGGAKELRLLEDALVCRSSSEVHTARRLSTILENGEKDTYWTYPLPLQGHRHYVSSIAFLSLQLVISGSWDCTLRVWSIETGEALGGPLLGHTDHVYSIAVSPDGSLVASGSLDRTIRTWKFIEGTFAGQGLVMQSDSMRGVNSVAFSPDGLRIVSGSDDGFRRIWDPSTGREVGVRTMVGHDGWALPVVFSPDGANIASGSYNKTVRLWDAEACQPLGNPLLGHLGIVYTIAFSPDGLFIASGSADKTIRIWKADTSELVHTLAGHSSYVCSVAFSPSGRHLASAAADKTVRIWEAVTGELVGVLEGHTAAVKSVAFSADGTRIASGSFDRTVRIWDRIPVSSPS